MEEYKASRAICKEWLKATDRWKPEMTGKSYAEVLKTGTIPSRCIENTKKTWWPPRVCV